MHIGYWDVLSSNSHTNLPAFRQHITILMGNSAGKRPLGRPRHRWVDNIIIALREIGWDGMDWINLAQGRDH
jgi:hypothetical protein